MIFHCVVLEGELQKYFYITISGNADKSTIDEIKRVAKEAANEAFDEREEQKSSGKALQHLHDKAGASFAPA